MYREDRGQFHGGFPRYKIFFKSSGYQNPLVVIEGRGQRKVDLMVLFLQCHCSEENGFKTV